MFSIHHLIIGVPKFHQYPHIASIFPNFVYLKQWPLMPLAQRHLDLCDSFTGSAVAVATGPTTCACSYGEANESGHDGNMMKYDR